MITLVSTSLFGQLLDGLFELGWFSGSEIEPAEAEFHSFVKQEAIDLVCQSAACLHSVASLVSVLGGI